MTKDFIKKPHIIVLGNEKGGSGKTTTAMHLLISLLKLGMKVASIDLDYRQQSLTRYIENRKESIKKLDIELELPDHYVLSPSNADNIKEGVAVDEQNFDTLMRQLDNDFVIIDAPGSDTFFSRLAHSYADTVITPINDSFLDVSLLGEISADKLSIKKPGIYSAMLWEQRVKRAAKNKAEMKWFVVRNRLSMLDAKNKRNIDEALSILAKRFHFVVAPGFGDRVIFKELYLHGLTLHDANKTNMVRMSTSVLSARQELREFLMAIDLPGVMDKLAAA
jgi:chromosome partitioning protein